VDRGVEPQAFLEFVAGDRLQPIVRRREEVHAPP
jgi:hypothetical protein